MAEENSITSSLSSDKIPPSSNNELFKSISGLEVIGADADELIPEETEISLVREPFTYDRADRKSVV